MTPPLASGRIREGLSAALRFAGKELPESAEPMYSESYEEVEGRVYLTLRISAKKEGETNG